MVSETVKTRRPGSGAGGQHVPTSAPQPSQGERPQNVGSGLTTEVTAPPVATETCIEHCYPQSFRFVQEHGPDAIGILHDLITHADQRDDQLVVQASVRQIAERLPFLSKDTVHRRLRQLHRAHIIRTATTKTASRFERPTYVLDLTGTGISVTRSGHAST